MKRFPSLKLSAVLTVGLLAVIVVRAAEPPLGPEYRVGGFVVGCQAYMFHRFTAFEAIEKTAAAGGKVIEFYPGQSFSPGDRKTKLTHNLPEEALLKLQEKLKQHNLIAVNYGVVEIPRDEADARRLSSSVRSSVSAPSLPSPPPTRWTSSKSW